MARTAYARKQVEGKSLKKKATKAVVKKTTFSTHPPTAQMVVAAVKSLKERRGCSLQAIKKYISATYQVDGAKLAPFIRKYIKTAVAAGNLVQTKGTGAAGSFKLPKRDNEDKKKAAAKQKKAAVNKMASAKKSKDVPNNSKSSSGEGGDCESTPAS